MTFDNSANEFLHLKIPVTKNLEDFKIKLFIIYLQLSELRTLNY
jgi:hypothetical protein